MDRLEVVIPISSLGRDDFDRAIFKYLCYRCAISRDIAEISISISILTHTRRIKKNQYFYYSSSKIYEDLNNLKLSYSAESHIDINITTDTSLQFEGGEKSFNVTISLILSILNTGYTYTPVSYNVHIFNYLNYISERPTTTQKFNYDQ